MPVVVVSSFYMYTGETWQKGLRKSHNVRHREGGQKRASLDILILREHVAVPRPLSSQSLSQYVYILPSVLGTVDQVSIHIHVSKYKGVSTLSHTPLPGWYALFCLRWRPACDEPRIVMGWSSSHVCLSKSRHFSQKIFTAGVSSMLKIHPLRVGRLRVSVKQK